MSVLCRNRLANLVSLTNAQGTAALITLASTLLITSGCQSLPHATATSTSAPVAGAQKLARFNITGKIGVTTPATDTSGAQGGSAFYAWGQQDDRFAIELIGALGIGKTNIEYDGRTATLVSEKTGRISAEDPEALLQKATGWQAPISQLPYWISGRPAPSDSDATLDQNERLLSSVNGAWTAQFSYDGADRLPSKIRATRSQGQKVVMTINHQTR